ncbi:hypothetical protein V501_02237 [Pseudogymnoascus sp. VKM F-4519 (FW-2642)]|nr:hypothetical protein V501_02237 [Pseudogymnoascus sp. VKM F-4519 (FW-2642)]
MEDNVFCGSNLQPYRPKSLDHEPKFTDYISWAKRASLGTSCAAEKSSDTPGATEHYPYAVQLDNPARDFLEITADDLVDANFEKVNSHLRFSGIWYPIGLGQPWDI